MFSRSCQLCLEDLPWRHRHGLFGLAVNHVTQNQRCLIEPRRDPQRAQVRASSKVAVAALPVGVFKPCDDVHVYVYGHQIVAGFDPFPSCRAIRSGRTHHMVQEEPSRDTLAHQATMHIGKSNHHRIDLTVSYESIKGRQIYYSSSSHRFSSRRSAVREYSRSFGSGVCSSNSAID